MKTYEKNIQLSFSIDKLSFTIGEIQKTTDKFQVEAHIIRYNTTIIIIIIITFMHVFEYK